MIEDDIVPDRKPSKKKAEKSSGFFSLGSKSAKSSGKRSKK